MSYNTRNRPNSQTQPNYYSNLAPTTPQRRAVPQTNFITTTGFTAQQPQQQTPEYAQSLQQQQPVKPLLTPGTVVDSAVNNGNNGTKNDESTVGEEDKPKSWNKFRRTRKLNNQEKRDRRKNRNARIGRLIRPKNAVMVLNELLTDRSAINFEDKTLPNGQHGVVLTVEGHNYEGYGASKNAARQRAAENALKSYVTNKLSKYAEQQAKKEEGGTDGDVTMETEDANVDDVSWCQLASFAIFKLMDGWQEEGMPIIPTDFTSHAGLSKPQPPKTQSKPRNDLPANAAEMHPVMLLNQMRPGTQYTDDSVVGQPSSRLFTVKCVVDGQEFVGCNLKKKEARKACAAAAVSQIFGITPTV